MADIPITAANVLSSSPASVTPGTAGATITAGQALYQDSDLTYKLADANGASPLYQVVGIALHGASSGQPIDICTLDSSFTLGGTVAAGDTVWLSATPGGLTLTAADNVSGMFVAVIGVGIGSNKIKLNITRADVVKA